MQIDKIKLELTLDSLLSVRKAIKHLATHENNYSKKSLLDQLSVNLKTIYNNLDSKIITEEPLRKMVIGSK